MYNSVIFYNHFGAGDVFESREFVKGWMKLVEAKEYFYAHGKHPRILLDIPELKYMEVDERMQPMEAVDLDKDNNLLVNTWIGRDGGYVLPGIGCTVEELLKMHNSMLKSWGYEKLKGKPIDYIPDIDYSKYDIGSIEEFMRLHPEDKVLIDNGRVQSMQANNFEMGEIILTLADKYPDKCFIVTHPIYLLKPNIYCTDDIISTKWGFDLNEISYISTFCSTLIGRNSGPHVFSQVKRNVMDSSKKLVSFTYQITGASFVINTPVTIEKYWSDADEEDTVIQALVEVFK